MDHEFIVSPGSELLNRCNLQINRMFFWNFGNCISTYRVDKRGRIPVFFFHDEEHKEILKGVVFVAVNKKRHDVVPISTTDRQHDYSTT
jgi:hypothetical protein